MDGCHARNASLNGGSGRRSTVPGVSQYVSQYSTGCTYTLYAPAPLQFHTLIGTVCLAFFLLTANVFSRPVSQRHG